MTHLHEWGFRSCLVWDIVRFVITEHSRWYCLRTFEMWRLRIRGGGVVCHRSAGGKPEVAWIIISPWITYSVSGCILWFGEIPAGLTFTLCWNSKLMPTVKHSTASVVLKRDTSFIQFMGFYDLLLVQATWSDECQLPLTYRVETLSMSQGKDELETTQVFRLTR